MARVQKVLSKNRRPRKPKAIYFVQGVSWAYITTDGAQARRDQKNTVGVTVFEYQPKGR